MWFIAIYNISASCNADTLEVFAVCGIIGFALLVSRFNTLGECKDE